MAIMDTDLQAAAQLQALLDGPHAELREQTRVTLSQLGLDKAEGLSRDDYRDLVLEWTREVGRTGDGARSFPLAYGGQDDPGGRVATFQTVGHSDLSLLVKMGVQFGLFGGAVHRLGTDKHHAAYLRDIGTLDLPGCFAMSESGHGSDVRSIRTQARYDADAGEFVIHTPDETARKDWIGNAARHGRMAAVFAQLDVAGEAQGVHCFLVPLRDENGSLLEGIEIEDCGDKMGLQGVDNGRIRFHAVRIPRDNLLDRFGSVSEEGVYSSPIASPGARFFSMIGALVEGRICIGGAGLAVARNALTIAVRWGETRRQFGTGLERDTPLMDYLTHQRRLLPAICESYVLQSAHDHLNASYVEVLNGGEGQREVEALAAGLKAVATWHMVSAVQNARECCGGKGYLAENRFASLRADSDVFTTFEGDNTVLMQLVAKTLLADYAAEFEDLDAFGMVRNLTSRSATRVLGDIRRSLKRKDFLDPSWQAAALEFREDRLIDSLARRLRTLVKEGTDPLTALNRCQDHALATARAHVERQAHELFRNAATTPLLEQVRDLASLSTIEGDRAWWLEHGFLSPEDSKNLQKQVNDLCAELRPHALTLVAGFGIPDALLRAPIALPAS
ncbi:MAG: acyl-CoA oxidase domain protein [Frankiales bacterium]|nr:acyl-CoA oxidase domain protein [Frankiales bacterium]